MQADNPVIIVHGKRAAIIIILWQLSPAPLVFGGRCYRVICKCRLEELLLTVFVLLCQQTNAGRLTSFAQSDLRRALSEILSSAFAK